MPLRCLLFCSDQEATDLMVRVLAELQIDAEHCPNAIMATERVTSQPFQFVILDWDDQPDAGLLLSAARTRKAAERPLTLAMVGEDTGVPKALQAGANSILRKPILVNQVRDTLTTARDLLRAKLEQSASTAKAMVAKASAGPAPALQFPSAPANLRAGEFLQSSAPQPGAQFITDSDVEKGILQEQSPAVIDPLKDLEPMAAALGAKDKTPEVPVSAASQPRGLAWYKARNAATAHGAAAAAAPALAPVPAAGFASALPRSPVKPELLGYDQTPSNTDALSEKPTPAASSMGVCTRASERARHTIAANKNARTRSPGRRRAANRLETSSKPRTGDTKLRTHHGVTNRLAVRVSLAANFSTIPHSNGGPPDEASMTPEWQKASYREGRFSGGIGFAHCINA